MKETVDRKKSVRTIIGYSTGDILGGGAFTLITVLFFTYLTTYVGLSAALAGVVVLVGKIWDAISDPVMGMISDHTHTKHGRRRIYFLIGIVPVLVTFTLLWYNFGITSQGGLAAYYILAYVLFSTAFTIVMVPYNSLLPEMVHDYKLRGKYSTFRMLFSNISALVSATVPSLIIATLYTSMDIHIAYLIMGGIFAILYALPLIITFFWTFEEPIPEVQDSDKKTLREMLKEFGLAFKNKTYRQYLSIFVFGQMATDVCSTVTLVWALYILSVGEGDLARTIIPGLVLIMAIFTLPINSWISNKWGKQAPSYILLPVRIISLVAALFLSTSSPIWLVYVVCAFNGIGASAGSYVPWVLLPDIPDSGFMITGKSNAGIYSSGATFTRKFTSGIAIALTGIVLEWFGYVSTDTGTAIAQTDLALFGIKFMFAIVPIVLSAITIYFALKYRLTPARYKDMKNAIDYRLENGKPIEDKKIRKSCSMITGVEFDKMWVGSNENGIKETIA
jgi:oligogalacturonide transporter